MPDATPSRRAEIPMQTRDAAISSFNAETRTIELVWSTGAPVRRMDWWTGRSYIETLSLDPAHVRLDRLNSGRANLLNTHSMYNLSSVMGVVEASSAAVDGQQGTATVRLSQRDDIAGLVQDVADGIIRNVSVGYIVHKYEITQTEGQPDERRAVDWEPYELSFVPAPADAGAGTRVTPQGAVYPCEFINRAPAHSQEDIMPNEAPNGGQPPVDQTRTVPPAGPPLPALTPEQIRAQAAADERTRITEIRRIAASFSLEMDGEQVRGLIDNGASVDAARAALHESWYQRGPHAPNRPRGEVGNDFTDPAVIRSAMETALAARATEGLPEAARVAMTDHARQFADLSILEMGVDLVRARGERVSRMAPAAMYDFVMQRNTHTTSDFPLLLANTGNKVLLVGYQLAAPTFAQVFARKRFRDFKPTSFLRSGDFPVLLEVGETGEYKLGTMSESEQKLLLGTFGRILGLSRRTIINDDLGAFADLPMKAGQRVRAWENGTAWAQLALNSGNGPTITEGGASATVFHADHGNLAGAGTAITVAAVGSGRAAMRKQKSLDGMKLNLAPRFLVTSPDKETEAEQFVATNLLANKTTDVNPFAGRLTPLADAELTGNAWYLFCDPSMCECFVYGYLEGAEAPRLTTREGFTTDGVELKLSHDFVAGAIDYRGSYKNPGA